MRLRYEQLFDISLTTSYYTDNKEHHDLMIEPTGFCRKQMGRFKILSRMTSGGIGLFYRCDPLANDALAFSPVIEEEKFTFKVKVINTDFWFYADVQNWENGKVFILKNPYYNSTGNITVLTGALTSSVAFRPMTFKYDLPLGNEASFLEIRDSSGKLIKNKIIRAKTSAEGTGATEQYHIDLENFEDGIYTFNHITSTGVTAEQIYCSADYSGDTLAIVEVTYKGDPAWTGIKPFQKYVIQITSLQSDWFYDIHIRKRAVPVIAASNLAINHLNILPEVKRSFSVEGTPDDLNGFVQFKSVGKLGFTQRPIHLQLINAVTAKSILDPLTLPSANDLQKDALNNLYTKVIINV